MLYLYNGELMNKKGGIYVGIVAVIALAALALVIYPSLSTTNEWKASIYANLMLETKRIWQNARFVLDKATADALADYAQTSGGTDINGAGNQVESYLNNALTAISNESGFQCTLDSFNYQTGAANNEAIVTIDLKCEQELRKSTKTSFKVSYAKEAVFEKRVESASPPQVRDLQSYTLDIS